MADERPDPETLLKRLQVEEERAARGHLKIYLGAAAGVGKTFAMLQGAHELRGRGTDVVVGYVETHRRRETESLIPGLEVLPRQVLDHRGAKVEEFDLDGALARQPAVILVDELAHTNAPGVRHAKRWQDVEELLAAGIDVHTAINVQHVESLNDVVAQITGVAVRETVPDAVLERADEIELVDLSPEDLLLRLQEGKVYVPEQAQRALNSFFRKGNLIALRELALRTAAQRVDAEMRAYREHHAIAPTWPVAERLLVFVGPSVAAARLVRAAKRMADRLGAPWTVAHVETPSTLRAPQSDRDRLWQTLRLAESLGADTAVLAGEDFASEAVRYARQNNASRILVGKPTHPRWLDWFGRSRLEQMVRASGGIDVTIVADDGEDGAGVAPAARRSREAVSWRHVLIAAAVVGIETAICFPLYSRLRETNLAMLYLLGLALISVRFGRRVSVFAALLSVVCFDFFFVQPRYTFAVADSEYVISLVVLLSVGLTISTLAARVERQLEAAHARERRTSALYALAKDLVAARSLDDLLNAAATRIKEVFLSQVLILLPDEHGGLAVRGRDSVTYRLDAREDAVAKWVFANAKIAGMTTDTLPAAKGIYLPLRTASGMLGVLGLHPAAPQQFLAPEELHFLEAYANQLALGIERRSEI